MWYEFVLHQALLLLGCDIARPLLYLYLFFVKALIGGERGDEGYWRREIKKIAPKQAKKTKASQNTKARTINCL